MNTIITFIQVNIYASIDTLPSNSQKINSSIQIAKFALLPSHNEPSVLCPSWLEPDTYKREHCGIRCMLSQWTFDVWFTDSSGIYSRAVQRGQGSARNARGPGEGLAGPLFISTANQKPEEMLLFVSEFLMQFLHFMQSPITILFLASNL